MTSAFDFYLRTGRRIAGRRALETKFNPWHDPDNGRFTFAGQGRNFGGGHRPADRPDTGRAGARQNGGASAQAGNAARLPRQGAGRRRTDPKNPLNYSLYAVKRGDTLTKVARLRKGLTAADLAWLNNLTSDRLQVGQTIKLPHQQFLDEGKRARDRFLALAHYSDMTDGKLPPNVARPPSIADQIEASGVREIRKNGYAYDIDMLTRTRRAAGEIRLQPESRSKTAQANAGKPDRRDNDDGGHYIAARFKGPKERFNHFAQDANFNRGAYRTLEDQWAKAVRSGKRVFVEIVPHYRGTSMRPYKLTVTWYVDGRRIVQNFPNERTGFDNGER